jgi:hypothetical protein
MARRGFALATLLAVPGCGGAALEGASSAPGGVGPLPAPVARYVPEACRDRLGKAAASPALTVERIEPSGRRPVLVETRPGYDSLRVEHPTSEGKNHDWVFRVTTESPSGPALAHELRVARAPSEPGRLRIADDFTGDAGDRSLRLLEGNIVLDCRLVKERSAALDTPDTLE